MAIATVRQQPNDVQDYDIDFSEWFPSGDTVVSAVITCAPMPTTPPSYALASPKVKVWVYQGLVSGTTYKITLRAISNDGREKEVELVVKCKET